MSAKEVPALLTIVRDLRVNEVSVDGVLAKMVTVKEASIDTVSLREVELPSEK